MKKIVGFILCCFLLANVFAQTYGGQVQARDNGGTVGQIKRASDALKVTDSVLLAKLNAGVAVTLGAAIPTGSNTIGFISNTAFTANAGTNLNTSALALESGGNLATLVARTPVLGQAAAASSSPVTLSNENVQELKFTGQAAQTATVNNIIPTTAGASATDVTGYRSGSIQVISTGTGGTFIFEGSNDNTNWQSIPIFNMNTTSGVLQNSAITATSSAIIYVFPINFTFIRLRIATTITGGSIQAFSRFAQTNFTPALTQVAQNTAGSLATTATIASGTVTTVSTVTSLTTLANGQTAHSSASTGSPVRAGGRVVPTTAATQDQTLVAGDAANLPMTTSDQLVTKLYSTAEVDWQYAAAAAGILNTTTAVTFKAASGTAGIRNYITNIQIFSEALTNATELVIRDGAAGTVIWRTKIPVGGTALLDIQFPTPLKGTGNTLLEVATLTASGAGAVYFNAQGYTGF